MSLKDTDQDTVASPSMPGMGKSKLDNLPKEELIKFAKKQMAMLQKLKSECTELEKEIKELKSKPTIEANEDIIQALTERLDNALLEKAEAQHQFLALKKENAKENQHAEDVIASTDELQKQWEKSNADSLKEIEHFKNELVMAQANHQEDVTRLQKELHESIMKQADLTDVLRIKDDLEDKIQRLQEELQQIKPAYEKEISHLTKKLEDVMEENQHKVTSLQESQKSNSERYHDEISNLHQELLKLKSAHQEELSNLMNELETSAKEYEQQRNQKDQQMQNLTEQFLAREKYLQEELNRNTEKYECELKQLREYVETNKENLKDSTEGQGDSSEEQSKVDEEVKCLEYVLKELESKHSILKDELIYTNNVKIKLETEIQQLKDEYFHEREDSEFKINELQLAKEDYACVIEKLKVEFQNAKDQCEAMLKQHSLQIEVLEGKHKKEISDLNEALRSASEKEKSASISKLQLLQVQCEKLLQEKENAVSSYESLKETMVTLQAELGESAGKISQEFAAMKQQQAADVQELQQKLRVAYNEKDVLLETVNRLQTEVEVFLAKQEEYEELKQAMNNLQKKNEEVMTLLYQKDTAINELEEKMNRVVLERDDLLIQIKSSGEESNNLHEVCEKEQARILELQHKTEELDKHNCELKQNVEELMVKLKDSKAEKDQRSQKLEDLEKQIEVLMQEKEKMLNEAKSLQNEMAKLHEEKTVINSDLERFTCERESWLVFKEQAEDLEKKLKIVTEEKCQLSKLFESDQQQNLLVKAQLSSMLEEMGNKSDEGDQEHNVLSILKAIHISIKQMKEETQRMVSQGDKAVLNMQKEMMSLQEEHEAQCAEFRTLVEDHVREKVLLREELAAVVLEKEALQGDLLEMKNANDKTQLENQDLLTRIEELSEKLEHHETCTEQLPEKFSAELYENLMRQLEDKESELCNLKTEFMAFKDSIESSSAEGGDQSSLITELENKIDKLEKECKEKEDKSNKIKAVAVKAKKELDSSRKEVQKMREELELMRAEKDQLSSSVKDLIHGTESYKNLLLEYEKQAEELDLERERAGINKRQMEDLLRQFHTAAAQEEQLRSDKEDLIGRIETLQSNSRLLEAQVLDLQKAKTVVDKELEAEKILREQKIKNHNDALKQLEDLQMELHKEKKQLQKTMQELELVRKDAQKSTLMDMEIADYERLVKELNQTIMEKNNRLEDLEHEIRIQNQKQETLQEEITSLRMSVEEYEEKSTKMKELLVKTKKELADLKQIETDHLLFQASLKGELEANQQQVEIYKIQVAELTAIKLKVQEQLRASVEQQHRSISTYQHKIAALQDACSTAKAEQVAVASEFESYKVRVHNVLKQQKNKSASQPENEIIKQEREHIEMMVQQLKVRLQETQQNLQINATELQTLQLEHETLLDRHNKMLQETVAKEAELREKLCMVQSENMVLKSEHAQAVNQLTAQNEALQNSFRDQVSQLQEDHRKTMATLQQQLSKVEAQQFQLKNEPSITNSASSHQPVKNLRERRNPDLPLLDMYTVAREEGEGMETTETESVSSASTHVPSLEQLLNSPEAKFESIQWQSEFSKEELVKKLNATAKSVDHLNGLLHETEATNAILMEQITLLKNEIRRLERNQEREKSVANLEYLKNVLLQFIFLKAGSERQRLLPVIDTMLHLSPEEKGKLVEIAQGEEESASRSSGWASYLHSWSGLR